MGNVNYTPEQILNRAIGKEIQAKTMYEIYAEKVTDAQGKSLLKELAQEELGHKQILEKVDPKNPGTFTSQSISKSDLADFSDKPEISNEATMQEVLKYAIAEELEAFDFYNSLTAYTSDETFKNLLNRLASEEKRHKQRLENLYDEMFQPEN